MKPYDDRTNSTILGGYASNRSSEMDAPTTDPRHVGCIHMDPKSDQIIKLDLQPKEPLREYAFKGVFNPEAS